MTRSRATTVVWGMLCGVLGVLTARCDYPGVLSYFPPLDVCCTCLATHETARGARCTRGSITDCVQDMERLDITTADTNLRCIRTVCGRECGFLAALLPPESATRDCCQCLADNKRDDGSACYPGSTDECMTEIEESELNKLLQGGGLCTQDVCADACAALFGSAQGGDDGGVDAGPQPDGGGGDAGADGGGVIIVPQDGGPHLPWDAGCPLNFPCF